MKVESIKMVGLMLLVGAVVGCDEVKVSEFGYDPVDSTRFIQAALDSGAKRVVLDRQVGPWPSLTLYLRSNTEFVLEPGVELQAKRGAFRDKRDYFVVVQSVTNVTLRGGAGSVIRMWKCDYQKPPYEKSEWRYALRVMQSENVLVEGLKVCDSGGDGIGIGGGSHNVTVRKCVFDNNHRQGASIFNVDGMLLEDVVFSNTKGTPPAAGIDFEPDKNGWKLSNCVLRNCEFNDNAGSGIEFYLNTLHNDSEPISVLFENCRTKGNHTSVRLDAGPRADDHVGGLVEFRNCSFAQGGANGIGIFHKTKEAFHVKFSDCEVTEPALSAVSLGGCAGMVGGPCDNIDFGNLKVRLRKDGKFFGYTQGFGPAPANVVGSFSVTEADGSTRIEKIDAAWRAKNMPVIAGGKMPPPRVALPKDVSVVDAKPGELVALAPMTTVGSVRKYLFFADKPGTVRFVGRQVVAVAGRKAAEGKKMKISAVGFKAKGATLPLPLDKSTEFTFDAPKRGFYVLTLPKDTGTRFWLEQASVPVAVDMTEKTAIGAGFARKPFSLWLHVRAGQPFAAMFGGTDYYRFRFAAVDPSGKTVAAHDLVENMQIVQPEAKDVAEGLWRFDFSKAAKPNYDWITMYVAGVPGILFLSNEKWWK